MPRVILADDSPSIRSYLSAKLRQHGWDVEDFPDGASAAERALVDPPDVVVTDLLMPGMSGVQLCRFLHAERATSHVPVVLLTARADRKSRYWARCAGAVAYVAKADADTLVDMLPTLKPNTPAQVPPETSAHKGFTLERLSALLDAELFESVIAGELRGLARTTDLEELFRELVALVSDVISYRWFAVGLEGTPPRILLHSSPRDPAASEHEARAVLGERAVLSVSLHDDRPLGGLGGAPPVLSPVLMGPVRLGAVALAPEARGLASDDKRIVTIIARELGIPLRIALLVEDTRRLASTDALTGILNRRAMMEMLERERSRSSRYGFPISLLLLDIDHFKRVNDTYGHPGGDAVLQGVSRLLRSLARLSDIVTRWGGEEFVVALPQTGAAGARIVAERLRRTLADTRHVLPDGVELIVTASIGVASMDAPWNIETLIHEADTAMYAAKARGRNRVEVASIEPPPTLRTP